MNNIKMIRISTHTLPWSVTYKEGGFTMAHMISTHTLTWSVTCRKIMTGQKTADFNSHAHVERDLENFGKLFHMFISTHTLTWSVTIRFEIKLSINGFQLTRSRGA